MFSDEEIFSYFYGVSFGSEIDEIKDKLLVRVLSIYQQHKNVNFLPSRWPLSLDLLDNVHFHFAVKQAFVELLEYVLEQKSSAINIVKCKVPWPHSEP